MTTSNLKIAIIGAGPGGATLARILHLSDVPFTLLEGEASSSMRAQGSTLDLHADTGQAAIKECQLWAEFKKLLRYDGEAMSFVNKKYRIYLQMGAGEEGDELGRPEIDRTALRQLLIDSLPSDAIQWGSHVREVRSDGTVLLGDDRTIGPFDLVIGADGAWSKVRPLLTGVKPVYSGIGGIGLNIDAPATTHPDLYKQVNRGSIFAVSDGKAIQPQQLGSGDIHVYTWSKRSENWMATCDYDAAHDVAAVRTEMDALFHDWHPQLRKFTQVANPTMEPRNLYMLPIGTTWPHRPGFTLLGDAAHLMTPFAGEGVNMAMADAMDLAKAITGAVKEEGEKARLDALDKNIRSYEEAMLARAKPMMQETATNMEQMFDTEPDHIEKMILRMMADAPDFMKEDAKAQIAAGRYGP